MEPCPVCGNDIAPATRICPHCESAIPSGNAGSGRIKSSRSGLHILNIKEGMPAVDHALVRLENGLVTARRAGAPVLKVIHGYGSGGMGGAICWAVRSLLAGMAAQQSIRSFLTGEQFRSDAPEVRQVCRAVPVISSDPDLDRANPGITVIFL